jgi:[ribosomal protein S5]-alanine N-acetyltransferase
VIPLPLETERLVIRPFAAEDATALFAVYGDPEVMRYIPGGVLADLDAATAALETYAGEQESRGFTFWALVERESGLVVGDVGFGIFEPTGEIELGWTLTRDRWGRGYATEAASTCLAAGLAHLGEQRIVAIVDAENEASARVAERIGMARAETIEAYGRQHVVFAAEV